MPAPFRQRSPAPRPAPPESGIPPGPHAGRLWRDPSSVTCDVLSGRTITRLTHYRGHSHHVAGPAPLWLDGGRRLIIVSDREGCGNLFVYDFAAATLTQLTDLRAGDRPEDAALLAPDRVAFTYGSLRYELGLASLRILPVRPATDIAPTTAPIAPLRFSVGESCRAGGRHLLWLARSRTPARGRHSLALLEAGAPHVPAQPQLSPDGSRVIFVRSTAGYTQIYAIETHDLTGG